MRIGAGAERHRPRPDGPLIGFRAVVDFFAWNNPEQDPHTSTTVARCLADETGGLFVTTKTVDELVAALQRTLGCPVIG